MTSERPPRVMRRSWALVPRGGRAWSLPEADRLERLTLGFRAGGASIRMMVSLSPAFRFLVLCSILFGCRAAAGHRHDTLSTVSSDVSGPGALALSLGFKGSLPPPGSSVALYPLFVEGPSDAVSGEMLAASVVCLQNRLAEVGVRVVGPQAVAISPKYLELTESLECTSQWSFKGQATSAFAGRSANELDLFGWMCRAPLPASAKVNAERQVADALGIDYFVSGQVYFRACPSESGLEAEPCIGQDNHRLDDVWIMLGGVPSFVFDGRGPRQSGQVARTPAEYRASLKFRLTREWATPSDPAYMPFAVQLSIPARCEEQVALVSTEKEKAAIRLIDQAMTLSFAAAGVWPTPDAR